MFNLGGPKPNPTKSDKPVKTSRRDFLIRGAQAAAGVALSVVPSMTALDAFDDPQFRQEFSDRVNEKLNNLQIQLESEVVKFEKVYGVKLKLRSVTEVNAVASKERALNLEQEHALKKILKETFFDAIRQKGFANPEDNKEFVDKFYVFQEDYLYKFRKGNLVPTSLSDYLSESLNVYEKLNLVNLLKKLCALYPKDFFRKFNLAIIDAGKDPKEIASDGKLNSSSYAGWHFYSSLKDDNGLVIYLDYSRGADDLEGKNMVNRLSWIFAHEIMHLVDNNNLKEYLNSYLAKWTTLFRQLGQIDYDWSGWQKLKETPKGFYRSYGVKSAEEDRATIAEALWTDYYSLMRMCETDHILQQKVNIIKRELVQLEPAFTNQYFEMLSEGNYDGVQKHLQKFEAK